jgi:hypothetical protein
MNEYILFWLEGNPEIKLNIATGEHNKQIWDVISS